MATLEPSSWVTKYSDYLYNFALVRVSSAQLAEDLVQETFLSGIRAKEGFKGSSTEKTWLTAILKNKIIDHYRKQARNKEEFAEKPRFRSEEPFKGHWLEENAPDKWEQDGHDLLENEEFQKFIQLCISLLPEKQAAIFIMKVIDECDSDEVCKEMGISASNLWVIIHRARLQLRECLEEKWHNH